MSNSHYYLEMIRLLEKTQYFEAAATNHATATAKASHGTGFEKLLTRAESLDDDGKIWQSLTNAQTTLSWLNKGVMLAYFLAGLAGGYGLLASQVINFFYLLILLVGWHTISLILWCIRPKKAQAGMIPLIIDKFWQKRMNDGSLDSYAYQVLYQANKPSLPWQIATIIHKNWLCALLGNVVALLGLFLFKNYDFFWESTILSHDIFVKMVKMIGFLPSVLGFDLSQINARTLALLILISVVLYAILPRTLAYLYSLIKYRSFEFVINKNLYYYENLLYTFSQLVIDKDDYVAPKPKPNLAKISKDKKVIATLERANDEPFWFQYGAGMNVVEFGVLDEADDFVQLQNTIATNEAQVYLGISKALLPDRGVIRKLEKIINMARFGIVVEMIGDGAYYEAWQRVLIEHNIDEVRRS